MTQFASDQTSMNVPGSQEILLALKSAETRLVDLDGASQSAAFLETIDEMRDLRRIAFTMLQVSHERENRLTAPAVVSSDELTASLSSSALS